LHPLPQYSRQARRHPVNGSSLPQPADHAKPRRNILMNETALAIDQGFLLQRDPDIGGSLCNVSPKNPAGATPMTVKGLPSSMNVAPTTEGSEPYVVCHTR